MRRLSHAGLTGLGLVSTVLAIESASSAASNAFAYIPITTGQASQACDGSATAWGASGYEVPAASGAAALQACYEACGSEPSCRFLQFDAATGSCHLHQACETLRSCQGQCGGIWKRQSVAELEKQQEVQVKNRSILLAITQAQVWLAETLDATQIALSRVGERARADMLAFQGSDALAETLHANASSYEASVNATRQAISEMQANVQHHMDVAGQQLLIAQGLPGQETAMDRTSHEVRDIAGRLDNNERIVHLLRPEVESTGHKLQMMEGRLRNKNLRGVVDEATDKLMFRLFSDVGATFGSSLNPGEP